MHDQLLTPRPVDERESSRSRYLRETRGSRAESGTELCLDAPRNRHDYLPNVGLNRPLPADHALGAYRVLEPLGQGGMGIVYRARHVVTEQPVAIKTVLAPNSRWIESIRREIDALSRIRHPGIVRILDHGLWEGRPWYAMDLLEGESLRNFGSRIWSSYRTASAPPGPLRPLTVTESLSHPTELASTRVTGARKALVGEARAAAGALLQVLGFMRRLCGTLAFLHGEGVVSCDLKPENIILVGEMPVVIDFGLSRRFPAATGREAMDGQRSLAGTLPYMSPEQARGELVDARSDLYSVGCILYELLTGAPPFTGSPYSVRSQHQSVLPTPPSQLVSDIPPALEQLVLRLLAKQPNERVGFADEVGAILGDLAGEGRRVPELPPARPYLYRPSFVGRADTLSSLVALRDAACHGAGALLLIGGESGVGKTRLVLELTRASLNSGLRVVASEGQIVAPEDIGTAGSSPLQVVRPLLRAIADRCQEGGPDATERLLGDRQSVLAQYEPLLNQVPAQRPVLPVVPLDPEASRQRLLRYLAQSLRAFALEQPVLWISDDLGWGDDLSLAFLRSLNADYFADTPVLFVGTYRSEEPFDALRELIELPHVKTLTLERLSNAAVSTMIADMLAAPTRHASFTDYVARAAEGNPFFVTEHVRVAVNERLFFRDPNHSWRMQDATEEQVPDAYARLPLPLSLSALVQRRLRGLSELAQSAARAAAVLGREFNVELLPVVAELSPDAARCAIGELVNRHVLEQSSAEQLRFVHDKLREVAYASAADGLRGLHHRAAQVIEGRWGADLHHAANLGHHYACAGHGEPALHHLRRAADHARTRFANEDAIKLYNRALDVVRALVEMGEGAGWRAIYAQLLESLGDVLSLGVDREAARASYHEALSQGDVIAGVDEARLHRKIGKTWEAAGDHERGLVSYSRARARLPVDVPRADDERGEWISSRFDELRAHYWLAHQEELDSMVRALQPVIEEQGTQSQRAGFYQSQVFYRLDRERYVVSDDTLELSRIVYQTFGGTDQPERAWTHFQHGFALLLARGPRAAEPVLTEALSWSRRSGDLANEARAALYLSVAARMRGSADEVARLSESAARSARDAGMKQYIAAILGNQAWLLLRSGDLKNAVSLSGEALQVWGSYGGVYPFHWLALLPRIRAQLSLGATQDAVDSCQALLHPKQRRLPPTAETNLLAAIDARRSGNDGVAHERIGAALTELAAIQLQ